MQKIFLIFIVCVFCLAGSSYAMTQQEYVSALEDRLFGFTYEGQNIDSRIDRIEQQIYDNTYAGTPEERLSKIDKIYPQADFEYPQNNMSQNNYYNQEYYEEIPKSDYNNYPIISKIEYAIYQKDYSGEDIYKRLSRLETELYGSEKSNLTLQERVENLKSVLPKKERNPVASNFGFNGNDFGTNNDTSGYFDTDKAITELEKGAFRKTFELDDTNKRLSRLEHYYFGQTSDNQADDERITRLASVAMTDKDINGNMSFVKNAQWAELLMNLLIIGLGFIL